jgi:hypothetical protein
MTISKLAEQAISVLTPQFLAVIILNIIFIGILFWFVDARAIHTAAVMQQLMDACLRSKQ